MKQLIYFVVAFVLCIITVTDVRAQDSIRAMNARTDSVPAPRYRKSHFDSVYVVRPDYKWTLKARVNQTGNSFHAKGALNGLDSKYDLSTNHKTTISVAAIYRGIGIALAINPAQLKGDYKDFEININYYSSRFSVDFSYQRSESLSGDIWRGEQLSRVEYGDVDMNMINFAANYTFNHRRFSYQAAFTQSYIQRRSAGSWLAGISYQGGTLKTTKSLLARRPDVPETRVYIGHVGIGGGYAFNLVAGKRWLFHLSIMPTFVIFNRNNMTVNGERRDANHINFNMLFNERFAIVHNFSPRFFAGLTVVMNNSLFLKDDITVNQNKWRARISFGVRL